MTIKDVDPFKPAPDTSTPAGKATRWAAVGAGSLAAGAGLAMAGSKKKRQPLIDRKHVAAAERWAGRKAKQAGAAGLNAASRAAGSEAVKSRLAMDTETPIGRGLNAARRGLDRGSQAARSFSDPQHSDGVAAPAKTLSAVGAHAADRLGSEAVHEAEAFANRRAFAIFSHLRKSAVAFDESKHPRGHGGRFEAALHGKTGYAPWDHVVQDYARRGIMPTLHNRSDGAVEARIGSIARTVVAPDHPEDGRFAAFFHGQSGNAGWDGAVAEAAAHGQRPRVAVTQNGAVRLHLGRQVMIVAPQGTTHYDEPTHQRPAPVIDENPERRTLARMPSYNATGSKLHGMPPAYTGSDTKELPIGSFTEQTFDVHKPEGLSVEQHQAVVGGLTQIMHSEREGTIAAGQEAKKRGKLRGQTLIPEGMPKGLVKKAYRHGALRAMHRYGVGTYDYKMDDALKEQMKPLEHFTLYSERRVLARMLGELKGDWKPYRQEFGQPFKDNRKDVNGDVRLRVKPLGPIVKAMPVGDLSKGFGLAKASDKQVDEAQSAAGAVGTAVGVGASARLLRQPIHRASLVLGRRTAASVRLAGRHAG